AAEAGVEVRVESFPSILGGLSPGVLDSVVANLGRNAIKYMGAEPVRWVILRVVDRDPVVRGEGEDTGPGLPPALEQSVFEPDVRGGTGQPGIGLGLATVQRIVRAHGGRVGVRSYPGKGCCFWFELSKVGSAVGQRLAENTE